MQVICLAIGDGANDVSMIQVGRVLCDIIGLNFGSKQKRLKLSINLR